MTLVRVKRSLCTRDLISPAIVGQKGNTGTGYNGWSPVLAVVQANRPAGVDAVGTTTTLVEDYSDGNISVEKFICWKDDSGTGEEPEHPINPYLGAEGYTTLNNAQNIRGSVGPEGPSGGVTDTGWVNMTFPAWYVHPTYTGGITQPAYRIYGKVIHFSGVLMIPPASGSTLATYSLTSKTEYSGDPNKPLYTAGTPNTTLDAVSPKAYRRLMSVRRSFQATGGLVELRTIIEFITDGAYITIRHLNGAGSNVGANVAGGSGDILDPINMLVSRCTSTTDQFLNYSSMFKSAYPSGTTTLPIVERSGVTSPVTFDCANATDIGGFLIDINDVTMIIGS